MPAAGPRFLARFADPSAPDVTVGVRFLVAQRHILTCAHVVNLALGRGERAQDQPTERDHVLVEFPLADDALCRARVERWVPPPASGIRGSVTTADVENPIPSLDVGIGEHPVPDRSKLLQHLLPQCGAPAIAAAQQPLRPPVRRGSASDQGNQHPECAEGEDRISVSQLCVQFSDRAV
jgi:hypothetical protein